MIFIIILVIVFLALLIPFLKLFSWLMGRFGITLSYDDIWDLLFLDNVPVRTNIGSTQRGPRRYIANIFGDIWINLVVYLFAILIFIFSFIVARNIDRGIG